MTTTARASWNARPVQLVEGDPVRVVAYGEGATKGDCGRTGVVARVNRTRVVVRFDTTLYGDRAEVAISGECLRVLKP